MNDETRLSWREAIFADLDAELDATRRVLERIPQDQLDWRPHEKSWPLGGLATHVANLPSWGVLTVQSDGLDLEEIPGPLEALSEVARIQEQFEENAGALAEALSAASDEALFTPWTLRQGQQVILSDPRALVLRRLCLSHMAHHRGQLTVYLRLLDVPLPSIFGPTADEAPGT